MSILDAWVAESTENKTLLDEETLILEVAEHFWEQMGKQDVTKAELARRMGISKARVSKLLDGSNNLTLRKIANMAGALNMKFNVSLESENNGQWETGHVEKISQKVGEGTAFKFSNASFQEWNEAEALAL